MFGDSGEAEASVVVGDAGNLYVGEAVAKRGLGGVAFAGVLLLCCVLGGCAGEGNISSIMFYYRISN